MSETQYDWRKDETVLGQIPSVEHAIGVFQGPGHLYGRTWFRGQSRAEWDLRPGILREGTQVALAGVEDHFRIFPSEDVGTRASRAEGRLNREFRRRAASLLPDSQDPVQVYLLAQHHGLPTRLLDWTTNLLAALFFATVEHPEADGKLFSLSPSKGIYPGRYGGIVEEQRTIHDPEIRTMIEALFSATPSISDGRGIIPLVPDLAAGRMVQQGACFTFHPSPAGVPLAGPSGTIIPREAKPQFQQTLRRIGISWGSLFPEPAFIARDLVTEFGLHP